MSETGEYEFAIHEVFYDENGNVNGWTDQPVTPTCPSENDLQYELTLMMEAFKKKTLDYEK